MMSRKKVNGEKYEPESLRNSFDIITGPTTVDITELWCHVVNVNKGNDVITTRRIRINNNSTARYILLVERTWSSGYDSRLTAWRFRVRFPTQPLIVIVVFLFFFYIHILQYQIQIHGCLVLQVDYWEDKKVWIQHFGYRYNYNLHNVKAE